jgi:uncharacterized protein with beta-barrel porin domain
MICGVIASSVFPGWYYNYGQIRFIKRNRTRREITYDTLHEIDRVRCIMELQSKERNYFTF